MKSKMREWSNLEKRPPLANHGGRTKTDDGHGPAGRPRTKTAG